MQSELIHGPIVRYQLLWRNVQSCALCQLLGMKYNRENAKLLP